MPYLPLEKIIDKAGYSSFKLVNIASKRAYELLANQARLHEAAGDAKVSTIALREISEGKIKLKISSREKAK